MHPRTPNRPYGGLSSLRGPLFFPFLLLGAAGCEVPEFQGPQIQSPPPAFTMNDEAAQNRRMFPERPVSLHHAWVEASWGNFSGIYINAHPGVLTRAHVEEAQQEIARLPMDRRDQIRDLGPVEELTVDGRTAYGWSEKIRSPSKGLEWVAYRAVIPYDTVSYAVEFISGEPGLKNRPDSLRTIVASFAVGKTTYNMPLILIAAGVLLLLLNYLRGRARARATRHASINLVQIPKKEEEGADGAGAALRTRSDAIPRPGGSPPPAEGPRGEREGDGGG
ncbi:MAG: hypothetical protein ACE5GJ_00800 [Gemmatimonadota bacterium]